MISPSDFHHTAKLARLTINPDEEYIIDQLAQAAEYTNILEKLDTTSVPPTFQVNNKINVFRPDTVSPSLSQSTALSAAPQKKDGYFLTTATIPAKGRSASG